MTSKMFSVRGSEMLVLENFKYRKAHTSKEGVTRWRCSVSSCTAKVYTCGGDTNIINTNKIHNHEVSKTLDRHVISNICKRKAVCDFLEKPSKIIRRAIENTSSANVTVTDVSCIRKSFYRARRTVYPTLPKTIDAVHIALDKLSPTTSENENFLLVNDKTENLVVLSCSTNLKFLCSLEKLYMDGTFEYCTRYFCQMFSIHGMENGHYIPLAFCLLRDKRKTTYVNCLRSIVGECAKLQLNLVPKFVVIDFEEAIHSAVSEVWENAQIQGCRFHLTQAWWRKIQNIGLSSEYRSGNSEIGKWLTHVFGLPFLNPEEVGDCFAFDLANEQPADNRITEFADYIIENYISEDSRFPPHLWAEASETLQRTTNACEAFHSQFNKHFYHSHPSVFDFLNVLLSFQTDSYIKMRSVKLPSKIRNRYVRDKQKFVKEQLINYKNGNITRIEFVKRMSYRFKKSL